MLVIIYCIAFATLAGAAEKMFYTNDFQGAKVGQIPGDFMVLEGAFVVKEEAGNKFLELPGSPLDTFDLLFGPDGSSDVMASARVFGTAQGRRAPTFRLGINGRPGYKLQISPGKKVAELKKDEDVIATVPFEWRSGSWTMLKLQIRKAGPASWIVEGKAWDWEQNEPLKWMLTHKESAEPMAGRGLIGGAPYAGTPVRFDDLMITTVAN